MKLAIFVCCMFCALCSAQPIQLVPNPGFEQYNSCPFTLGNIAFSSGYNIFPWVKDWANPLDKTSSDYYNACGNITVSTPQNMTCYQAPRSGTAYAGLIPYYKSQSGPYCEYLTCKLTNKMVQGASYEVSFYVCNKRKDYNAAMAGLGIHFSGTYVYSTTTTSLTLPYHVSSPANLILDDTTKWTLITGTYVANGSEEYMTLGWFNNGQTANIQGYGSGTTNGAYYLVDDVTVELKSVKASVSRLTTCNYLPLSELLTATPGNYGYKWSTGASTQTIQVTDTGTYWCTSRNDVMQFADTFHIKSFKSIIITDIDTGLCGAPALTLAGAANAEKYKWNNGGTDSEVIASTPGTYICEAIKNCTLHVTRYNVLDVRNVVSTRFDSLICKDGSAFSKKIQSSAHSADVYKWSTGDTANTAIANDTGMYWCIAIKNCIRYIDTFNFKHTIFSDRATLGADTSVCFEGLTAMLMLGQPKTAAAKYRWNTGDTSCCIAPQQTGTYTLTITDGCTHSSDTVDIVVNDCDSCIIAPDAFTPNADGLNDIYRVKTTCMLTDFQLFIVNRFGQKVFETDEINSGWDGTYNGTLQNLNTYYYMVRYKTANSKGFLIKKGSVILVR